MEKCTLESLYDVITNYYSKGYQLQFNMYFVVLPYTDTPRMLVLQCSEDDYYLSWDNSPDWYNRHDDKWDNEFIIKKSGSSAIRYRG